MEQFVDFARLASMLERSVDLIPAFPHGDWARMASEECMVRPQQIAERLSNLIHLLGLPDLGGVRTNPLETID
jgi:hypothetical protein